jgi:hypothetical protein
MHTVSIDSDLMLHFENGVEVDVLMTACNDVGSRFRRERRAFRSLSEISIAPTRSPEGITELWLEGEMAKLAVRVVCDFADHITELPEGISTQVMISAIAIRESLTPLHDEIMEQSTTNSR